MISKWLEAEEWAAMEPETAGERTKQVLAGVTGLLKPRFTAGPAVPEAFPIIMYLTVRYCLQDGLRSLDPIIR